MKKELAIINGLLDLFCETLKDRNLSHGECLAATFGFVKGIETICANLHVLEGTWDLVKFRNAARTTFAEIMQLALKAEK